MARCPRRSEGGVVTASPSHDRRHPYRSCCFIPMREIPVKVGTISLYICDRCGDRRWAIDGEEIGPELALRIAHWLDGD